MIRFSRVLGSTLIYASTASSSRFAGGHIAAAFLIESNAHPSHLQSRPSGTRTMHHISQPLAMVSSIENAIPNTSSCEEDANTLSSVQQQTIDILPYADTSHNSATITVPTNDEDGNENGTFSVKNFSALLTNTMTILQELEKSSLWVEVPLSKARLIEEIEAADLGFKFHHAQGSTLKLNAWLRKDIPSKVPEFATHHVGVGAVVINSRDEILCIRELRKNYHPWKIPTGLADIGESIHDAAEREVLEETGITASYHSILSFRHTHGMANGRSDLFFVCRLIPKEDGRGSVQTPVPQACEIAEAKWIPLSEYRDMVDGLTEESIGHPVMTFVMNQIFDKGLQINMKEVSSVIPGRRSTPLYFPEAPIKE